MDAVTLIALDLRYKHAFTIIHIHRAFHEWVVHYRHDSHATIVVCKRIYSLPCSPCLIGQVQWSHWQARTLITGPQQLIKRIHWIEEKGFLPTLFRSLVFLKKFQTCRTRVIWMWCKCVTQQYCNHDYTNHSLGWAEDGQPLPATTTNLDHRTLNDWQDTLSPSQFKPSYKTLKKLNFVALFLPASGNHFEQPETKKNL